MRIHLWRQKTIREFHNYDQQLKKGLEKLRETNMHPGNKDLVYELFTFLQSTGLSNARLVKYLQVLRELDTLIGKPFKQATKADIIRVVNSINAREYSVWTKQVYKVILKRLYKWLFGNKKFPDLVDWIVINIKRKDLPLPTENDLISDEEYRKMLSECQTTRDRAFLSTLYESGARIGEIGTLKLKDVKIDKYGVILSVNGKTGPRQIRIIESTQYLMSWLESHPQKDDRKAPLWTMKGRNGIEILSYAAIRKFLRRIADKAGIKKRIHAHLFRHSRATKMANHLTEFQMNRYFGWIQGSNMPSTYVHLSGKEIDEALLTLHGLKKDEEDEEEIKAKKCPRCAHINPSTVQNCIRCASYLDQKAAFEQEEYEKKKTETNNKTNKMLKTIMSDPKIQGLIIEKLRETGQLAELVNM